MSDITKIAGTSTLQDEILAFVISQRETADDEINLHRPIWDRMYKMWLRWRPKPKEGRVRKSRLFLPIVYNIIQTVLPLIMLTLFSVRRFLYVQPVGDEDDKGAKAIADLLAYQIRRVPDWFITMVRWIKSCLLYGTGILKPGWIDDTVEEPVFEQRQELGQTVARVAVMEDSLDETGNPIDALDEAGNPVIDDKGNVTYEQKQKTRRVGYYGPDFENIPLDNFRKDPAAKTMRKARWAYDETEIAESDVKEMKIPGQSAPFYQNLHLIKDISPLSPTEKGNAEKRAARGDTTEAAPNEFCRMLTKQDYWGVMPRKFLYFMNEAGLAKLSEDEKNEVVKGHITMLDDQLVILTRENDHTLYQGALPYISIIDVVDLEDFYGCGEAYPVEDFQHEANNNRNQWLTAMRRVLNERKYIRSKNGINMFAMKYGGDGALIEMDDVRGVVPEETKFDFNAANMRDRVIKDDITETASMYPQLGSQAPQAGMKATIYMSFEKALLKKFAFKAMLIEEMGIKEIGRWMMMLNALYLTEDYTFRVLNKRVVVTLDDMQQRYDYYPMGAASEPLSSLEARSANMDKALDRFLPYKDIINMEAWYKEYCEVNGIQNWKEKFQNPVENFFRNLKTQIDEAVDAGVPAEQVLMNILKQDTANGQEGQAEPVGPARVDRSGAAPLSSSMQGMIKKFRGAPASGAGG